MVFLHAHIASFRRGRAGPRRGRLRVSTRATRDLWGETFTWIRDYLGGAPQISENGEILGDNGKMTGVKWEPAIPWEGVEPGLRERMNIGGKPVDFGGVRTAGACLIMETDAGPLLKALPGSGEFVVELDGTLIKVVSP